MMASGTRQRLGVVIAVVLVGGAYAAVARAEALPADPAIQEVESTAAAGSTEAVDHGSRPASRPGEPQGQSAKSPTGPLSPTEPVSGVGETTEPTPATTEPGGAAPELPAEPVVEAAPMGSEPLTGSSMVVISPDVLTPSAGLPFTELWPDSSGSAIGAEDAGVPSDDEQSKPASPSVHDSGSLPPLPHAPASAGATGASAASAGGASGVFAVLVALLALAPLSLSGVLRLVVIPLRPPTLVADVQRPG